MAGAPCVRGFDACRLQSLVLAGAAGGEASMHAGCNHCWRQELPLARRRRMPLACIAGCLEHGADPEAPVALARVPQLVESL